MGRGWAAIKKEVEGCDRLIVGVMAVMKITVENKGLGGVEMGEWQIRMSGNGNEG